MAQHKFAPELRWIMDGGTVLQKRLDEHDTPAAWRPLDQYDGGMVALLLGYPDTFEFKRKPLTITIAGREIEAPVLKPAAWQKLWSWDNLGNVCTPEPGTIDNPFWTHAIASGRAFPSAEAARAAYDAITSLLVPGGAA